MKTVEKAVLKNYRSHENSTITFGALTSIIGENDQGKSNVYRGLEMVLLNQTFSEAQLRYGTKEGMVTVYFSDGTWIERTRKGSKQTCTLFNGVKSITYDTIKDITGIVQEFTGFKPIVIDKNSKPESVQLIPIDAGQTFLITGVSPDGVMRRINRLMSGAGVETARIALEKELRALEKSNASQELEMAHQQRVVDVLGSVLWGEIAEGHKTLREQMQKLDKLEEAESLLVEYGDIATRAEAVGKAKFLMDGVPQQLVAFKTMVSEVKIKEAFKQQLVVWKAVIETSMPKLMGAYDRDEAITKEMAILKPLIDAAKEEEFKKKQAEELAKQKVCPTCKRPL